MKKTIFLLVIVCLNAMYVFPQNKRLEDFKAFKKYFKVESSKGPFFELIPVDSERKKNSWLPKKKCYGVYVQTDNFSGATSSIVLLSKKYNLQFSEPIKEFRQDADDKYAKRGYIVIYEKMKGKIPEMEPLPGF